MYLIASEWRGRLGIENMRRRRSLKAAKDYVREQGFQMFRVYHVTEDKPALLVWSESMMIKEDDVCYNHTGDYEYKWRPVSECICGKCVEKRKERSESKS
jgi:hypothetical protein